MISSFLDLDGLRLNFFRDGESHNGSPLDFSKEETLESMDELEVLAQIRDDSLYQVADIASTSAGVSGNGIYETG
jgi:hypothetical protein